MYICNLKADYNYQRKSLFHEALYFKSRKKNLLSQNYMQKVVDIEDENGNESDNMAIMKAKVETDFLVGNLKEALKTINSITRTNYFGINTAKILRYTHLFIMLVD